MHARRRDLSIRNSNSGDFVRLKILNLDGIERDAARGTESLSRDELRRAERMRFERDRSRFVAVRAALREAIGETLSIGPAEVVFRYGPHGKPAAEGSGNVEFNVSHSEEIGLIVVARGVRVGVDVESTSSRAAGDRELAASLLSRRELDILGALPPDRQREAFMAWWTRKEAYVKALGCGLSLPLASFSVSFLPDATPQLFDAAAAPIRDWSLLSFEPKPGYIAAVVIEGDAWSWNSDLDSGGAT